MGLSLTAAQVALAFGAGMKTVARVGAKWENIPSRLQAFLVIASHSSAPTALSRPTWIDWIATKSPRFIESKVNTRIVAFQGSLEEARASPKHLQRLDIQLLAVQASVIFKQVVGVMEDRASAIAESGARWGQLSSRMMRLNNRCQLSTVRENGGEFAHYGQARQWVRVQGYPKDHGLVRRNPSIHGVLPNVMKLLLRSLRAANFFK